MAPRGHRRGAGLFVACGVAVAAFWALTGAFVLPGGQDPARLPRAPRIAASASGGASFFDTLLQLPDIVTEAVEDAQDLFGQGSSSGMEPMEVSSLGMAEDGVSRSGLLQTMSLRAAVGSERRLARQVAKLIASARADPLLMTATASQNKEDPCDFIVFLRYRDMAKMSKHQSSRGFKDLLEAMEPQLERGIGLYLTDESMGQIGMARHPFGPGGEGGRDDAIYSSRSEGGRDTR
mmetsp:Transcript_585/g.1384  ORF Transcript_585/g.1384 Transcript_585/m.1384 type:complete len:235 (+) Transcript_585:74-778(+)